MIAYLDTTVVVPLLIDESTTANCRELVTAAEQVLTSQLTYVETTAAVMRAERMGRVTSREVEATLDALDSLWGDLRAVEVNATLVGRAAEIARRFGLRGYDAVHCASAATFAADDLVACAGDRSLLVAWQAMGLSVRDTNADYA